MEKIMRCLRDKVVICCLRKPICLSFLPLANHTMLVPWVWHLLEYNKGQPWVLFFDLFHNSFNINPSCKMSSVSTVIPVFWAECSLVCPHFLPSAALLSFRRVILYYCMHKEFFLPDAVVSLLMLLLFFSPYFVFIFNISVSVQLA